MKVPSLFGFLKDLPAIVLVQLLATLVNSAACIIKLFLPLYFREVYEFDLFLIGALMSVYGFGCVSGSYLGGRLSAELPAYALTVASLLLSGILTMALALQFSLGILIVLLAGIGIFDGIFRPANLRIILEASSAQARATAQGMHRVAYNLGVSVAGILAGVLVAISYSWLFLYQGLINCCCGVGLVAFAFFANTAQNDVGTSEPKLSLGTDMISPWRDRPFLLFIAGQLIALAIFDQMYGTFGIFLLESYGLGAKWLGALFAMNAILVVIFQLPVAKLIERRGVIPSARLGLLFLSIGFLFLNISQARIWAIVAMFVLTWAELILSPAWTVAVMQRSEGIAKRGEYIGIYSAAWLGHSLYGPTLGAWFYGFFGGAALWWFCFALGALVFLLHYRSIELLMTEKVTP